MLALREFFWGPWPVGECGDLTRVIADFTVMAPSLIPVPATPGLPICARSLTITAPSNTSSPEDIGLPVCSRVIVVSS